MDSRQDEARRTAELELRWQDERAQRQRAEDLFQETSPFVSDDGEEDV
jgi:hypothetical protein